MSCILIPFLWGWINPSFPVVWQQKMLMGLWQGRRKMGRGKLQRYITGIWGLSGQELKVLEFQYLFYLCHHLWDEANHISSLFFWFCHLQNGDNVALFAPTGPDTFLNKLFLNPTEAEGAMAIHTWAAKSSGWYGRGNRACKTSLYSCVTPFQSWQICWAMQSYSPAHISSLHSYPMIKQEEWHGPKSPPVGHQWHQSSL